MTLDECRDNVGAGVVYDPGYGPREDGMILRVGDLYPFVLFVGDRTAKATPAEHLTLTIPTTPRTP